MSNINLYTNEDLELLWRQPHLIGHLAGKDKLTPLHSEWIRYMWENPSHAAMQSHRGSYKTTCMSAGGAIRHMAWHPDERGAIIRKTFTDAADTLKMISDIMERPEIQALFYATTGIWPKATVKRAEKLTYNFKRTSTPEGSINAHGLDASLTGKHYDWIWCDDFVTLKDRISKAERNRTKEVIREIITNIIDPGKPVMFTGTPWHRDDAWNIILFDNEKQPLIQCPKYPVSVTGLRTEEELIKIRKFTTPFLYAANYDLDLVVDEGKLFQDPVYGDWDSACFDVQAQLDAAFDGDHMCALTIMGRFADGKKQGIGWVYPGNVKDWAPKIASYCKQYKVKILHNETNPDKGYTASLLRSLGVNVKEYVESQNKNIKISTILYEAWPDLIWSNDTDPEFMNMILDWSEGQEPDDAPDSASSLLREGWQVGKDSIHILNQW